MTRAFENGLGSNTSLADMVQATVKGRAAGAGNGAPVDLSATQLATLMGFVFQSAENGYLKIPSTVAGTPVILQWGITPAAVDTEYAFPIAFPYFVAAFAAIPVEGYNGSALYAVYNSGVTLSTFTIRPRYVSGATAAAAALVTRWFALGW